MSERTDKVGQRAKEKEQVLPNSPGDEQMRAKWREVVEWGDLHYILHEVWTAFSVFRARLGPARGSFEADERQALLQDWRLCQDRLDALADFAAGVERIGLPLRREGRKLRGERWAVEILALQLLFEDVLKEDDPAPVSLHELAGEFELAYHRHLALADRELRAAGERLQRLSARLLGGTL
ncbi:MAG: hypothetical protein DRI77_04775 [Chloroflexi bacterium]|nr:MAG: hypothetical protein DRI77_04775 [Chloroflexota bacterium]